jgi:hypothetical protein
MTIDPGRRFVHEIVDDHENPRSTGREIAVIVRPVKSRVYHEGRLVFVDPERSETCPVDEVIVPEKLTICGAEV